jgi:hypothetical protein
MKEMDKLKQHYKLAIKMNNVLTDDPCAICGYPTNPSGIDFFLADGWELVCELCAWRSYPELYLMRKDFEATQDTEAQTDTTMCPKHPDWMIFLTKLGVACEIHEHPNKSLSPLRGAPGGMSATRPNWECDHSYEMARAREVLEQMSKWNGNVDVEASMDYFQRRVPCDCTILMNATHVAKCRADDFVMLDDMIFREALQRAVDEEMKADIEERLKAGIESIVATAKREMEQYGLDTSTLDNVLAEAVTT